MIACMPAFVSAPTGKSQRSLFASRSAGEHSANARAITPNDVLNGFNTRERKFGETFDVSSHAAVIKMMMARFGQKPDDLLEAVTPLAGGFDITMKDSFALHLSAHELKQVELASGLTGTDHQMLKTANFMLAAFAKRKQLQGRQPSFEAALSTTLRGETTYNALKGMGMIGLMQRATPEQMRQKGAVAVVSPANFSGGLALNGVVPGHRGRPSPVNQPGYMLAAPLPPEPDGKVPTFSGAVVGAKPGNILSGFVQGGEGNCVTVSAIKAAMMKYGQNPLGIFKRVVQTPAGYTVTMRDNCVVRLTHAELDTARAGSQFRGTDKGLLQDAVFLYAVSAKRAQRDNHEFSAGQSFDAAMCTLNDGEIPGDALRRLGLHAFIRSSTVQELANGATGTLANYRHSVAVVNGVLDDYGAKRNLATSHWMEPGGMALKLV